MHTRIILLVVVIFAVLAQPVFAGDSKPSSAIRTMATITNYMNHFPGEGDKGKLRDIVNNANSPSYEKTLASAMLNMHHKVKSGDMQKLMTLMDDKSAPQAARDLAKVLHDFNHEASGSAKKVLKQYVW